MIPLTYALDRWLFGLGFILKIINFGVSFVHVKAFENHSLDFQVTSRKFLFTETFFIVYPA